MPAATGGASFGAGSAPSQQSPVAAAAAAAGNGGAGRDGSSGKTPTNSNVMAALSAAGLFSR